MSRRFKAESLPKAGCLQDLIQSNGSNVALGQSILLLGRDYEGDGGEGIFVRVPLDSTIGLNVEGNVIVSLDEGTVIFVRADFLYEGVVEPRWFGNITPSRVLGMATQSEREANWEAICKCFDFIGNYSFGQGTPARILLPVGKTEVDVHREARITKDAGGVAGTKIIGRGADGNGTWLLPHAGTAETMFDVVSTNGIEMCDFRVTGRATNSLKSYIRYRAGDWYDTDGTTRLGNNNDKSFNGYIHDIDLQLSHADYAPSEAGLWLYGVGGMEVSRCRFGNSRTFERGIKLGASSLPGRPARQQLPKGIVDNTVIEHCNFFQSRMFVEKASTCSVRYNEFITGAGVTSNIKAEGSNEIQLVRAVNNQFFGLVGTMSEGTNNVTFIDNRST